MKIKYQLLFAVLTLIACEGPEGKVGPNGLKSLIKTTTVQNGTDCPNGGIKIETGIDENSNNILDADEIDNFVFICNGQNGSNGLASLIKVTSESQGANCGTGGYKVETGLDNNGNNVLDPGEISNTSYLCNGQVGLNGVTTLVKATVEPNGANCVTGGYKIETGLDINDNNILDSNESTNSIFVCNGQDNFLTHVAIVNQTGANGPQSTVIKNTLDINIAWARISQGKFKGTLSKNLDLSKTVILNNNIQVNCKFISSSEITLENSCGVNAFCDDFSNLTLEIKSFN